MIAELFVCHLLIETVVLRLWRRDLAVQCSERTGRQPCSAGCQHPAVEGEICLGERTPAELGGAGQARFPH